MKEEVINREMRRLMDHFEYVRGYIAVELKNGDFIYNDTHEPCNDDRPCKHCNKYPTPEGYDDCLGHLENVKYACCGHGIPENAYIIFNDGKHINGKEVAEYLETK